MSLLIVTSRYLKSGTAKTKSQRKNYTKYIATRESVEVREQSKKYSTENQKKLLNELLNDFPESKNIWNLRITKIILQLKMRLN